MENGTNRTAGSVLAELVRAHKAHASPEEIERLRSEFQAQARKQLGPDLKGDVTIEVPSIRNK